MDAVVDPVLDGNVEDEAEGEAREATVEDLFGDDDEPVAGGAPAADADATEQ